MLAVLLSAYVLFVPSPAGPQGPPGADKAVHAALFALLAASARWRFGSGRGPLPAVAAYALGSELVQHLLLPGRSGDTLDLLADLAGAAAGWCVVGNLVRRRCRRVTN